LPDLSLTRGGDKQSSQRVGAVLGRVQLVIIARRLVAIHRYHRTRIVVLPIVSCGELLLPIGQGSLTRSLFQAPEPSARRATVRKPYTRGEAAIQTRPFKESSRPKFNLDHTDAADSRPGGSCSSQNGNNQLSKIDRLGPVRKRQIALMGDHSHEQLVSVDETSRGHQHAYTSSHSRHKAAGPKCSRQSGISIRGCNETNH